MSSKLLIVTNPDDVLDDGLRLLLVDLTEHQNQIVSTALSRLHNHQSIIIYSWKNNDDISWLLDKKHKSSIIMFNAETENQLLCGYLSAQKSSYYFGTLRDLSVVNKSAIHDPDQCLKILEETILKNE